MTLDPFQLILDQMQDGFRGVHDRLDTINGRTRENEKDIAVLKDRATRDTRAAAAWSGGSALTVVGIIEAVKAMFK